MKMYEHGTRNQMTERIPYKVQNENNYKNISKSMS